jgi:hypothetical protein
MPTPNVAPVGRTPTETVATWVWRVPADPSEAIAFAVSRGVREVHLAVGPDGVDRSTALFTESLRGNGIAVSCLGGDPQWTVDHDAAAAWLDRAADGALFDGVHLDVEPWALPQWPGDAARLMAAYATLIETLPTRGPLAVDVVPWFADGHRDALDRVVRHCDSITALAYRDRAARIIADVSGIRGICLRHGRRYRIGVETQVPGPSVPRDITFADDGSAVMARELASVAAGLDDGLFDGVAVHHLDSWRAMSR